MNQAALDDLGRLVTAWAALRETLPKFDGEVLPVMLDQGQAIILVEDPQELRALSADISGLRHRLSELLAGDQSISRLSLVAADSASLALGHALRALVGTAES